MSEQHNLPLAPIEEAPYEIVPAGPRLRTVAWPQVSWLVLVVALTLLPIGLALVLAA